MNREIRLTIQSFKCCIVPTITRSNKTFKFESQKYNGLNLDYKKCKIRFLINCKLLTFKQLK